MNDQLSGVTEGSSQTNTWPAAQNSPWFTWTLSSLNWLRVQKGRCRAMKKMWKLSQTDVTVGGDRLCLILLHVLMPPIAPGQTWLSQPLSVSTVPNLGGIYLTAAIEDSTKNIILYIFDVLSIRYVCLLYSKALFINNDRPHRLHDLLVSGLRNDEPASLAQHTVASLHADFTYPHC